MGILTYDPAQVSVSLAGLYTIEGYANGTFLEISKDTKPYSNQTAMDGEVSRLFLKDDNFTIHLTLAQSSLSNNILSALHSVDLATQLGKFPILIQDKSGTTKFFSTNAWIESYPDASFGNSLDTRQWTIQCSNGVYALGGNDLGTTATIASLLALAPDVADILGGP